ncbi:hypothetical protein L1885_18870, partial [Streptomyces fuscigenes]|nr:hypothetical protein [Streptomyces fuscigenes]
MGSGRPALCLPGGAPRLPLRRGTADPVKLLLHRYRQLCERAVDPLEIAAGLEAHGISDREALTRFRHRDVFALAEELYARVPRDTDPTGLAAALPATAASAAPDAARPDSTSTQDAPAGTDTTTGTDTTAGTDAPRDWDAPNATDAPAGRDARARPAPWTLVTLLPGVTAALTLYALDHLGGATRFAAVLAGAFACSGAVAASLRGGPLRIRDHGRTARGAGPWVHWLLAWIVCGDGLLAALVGGGAWHATLTPLVALAFATAPAAWSARLFAEGARRRLTRSRALADFAARARPLLLAGLALYGCA